MDSVSTNKIDKEMYDTGDLVPEYAVAMSVHSDIPIKSSGSTGIYITMLFLPSHSL
jgi:hypothetical protein